MADIVDTANDEIDYLLAQKLKDLLDKQSNRIGAKYCVDCEVRIPDARRLAAMGCERCVDCASIAER